MISASAPSNNTNGFGVGFPSASEDARYLSCPKCSELKKNSDAAALKIHLLQQHYTSEWDRMVRQRRAMLLTMRNNVALVLQLDSTPRDSDTLYYCDLCPSRKRFVSTTAKGVRGAITCHWAIQHGQLKEVLQRDPEITGKFIDRLYKVRTWAYITYI
jgi:hypothetical protein